MAGNVYTLHFKLTDGTEVPVEFIVPQGVSVINAAIDDNGHLIITLSDGKTIDAGEVKGGGGTSNLNLVNGEAEGSLRSVGATPETDSYKLGKNAVAIGQNSAASGYSAFATGFSSANSRASSALSGAVASAEYSTACGERAVSHGKNQFVCGRHNIWDLAGKYAFLVGNGNSPGGEQDRSNAHTLDWNGNAWFAGDVIVGGKSQDDTDAKVLATKEYVDGKVGEIKIPEMPEIPTVLPNPNALTFSGAVNGSYDGSAPLSVNIPDGVKSWNDLEDKPFDMSKQVILSETTLVGNMDDGSTIITDPLPVEPVVGKTYVVNWHGKKYECVAGEVDIDFMCTYLGNVGAAGAPGAEDTGEPFMILFVPSAYAPVVGFTAAIYALDGSAGGVVSVDYVEVIKKIDEALLPEDYINSLIDAKIAAIPSAEEASF